MSRLFYLLVTLISLPIFGYLFIANTNHPYLQLLPSRTLSDLSPDQLFNQLQNLATKQIFTSTPLRGPFDKPGANLTINGILTATNQHRTAAGLKPLQLNSTLNQAAALKTSDMLAKQYFEHTSPSGVTHADLADQVGYEYLQVGENLALGNYESDAALTQAWMDSPGHRENIMKPSYTEIGIATSSGSFEGNNNWLSVQTFGTPASTCPTPNPQLQAQFDQQYLTINNSNTTLDSKQDELSSKNSQLTTLTNQLNTLIKLGNQQLESGNAKITQGNTLTQNNGDLDEVQALWDEGKTLQSTSQTTHAQAKTKQTELTSLQNQIKSINKNFNQQITDFDSLQTSLQGTTKQLNQQIRDYQQCLDALGN